MQKRVSVTIFVDRSFAPRQNARSSSPSLTFYVWCDPTSPGFARCDRTNATRFGNIVLLANAFMAAPVTGSTDATWIQLTNPGPSGTDIQDFVGPVRGGSTQSVPEPSSLALLGIGLIATAVAKRRRVLEKF